MDSAPCLPPAFPPPPLAAISPNAPPQRIELAPQPFSQPQQATSTNPAPQSLGPPLPLALRDRRSATEAGLREYTALQRRRYKTDEVGIEERLRVQAANVITDIRALRDDVLEVVKEAEEKCRRRWIVGGVVASFIPIIRAIFRRPSHDHDTANTTEYAFRRSRSLLSRIRASLPGKGRLATIAAFVFAVLYVFSNEVTLR